MRNQLHPIIDRYLAERRDRDHLSHETIRNLRNHLYDFAVSYGQRTLDQLGPRAVDRWLVKMRADGLADSTIALRLSSLRVFARWCVRTGAVARDWTTDMPAVRRPRRQPKDVTEDHAFALLAVARDERERLIVWLEFGCGLRCVEVSRLNVDDYDPVARSLHVTGKGGHEREAVMPDRAVAAMLSYLAATAHTSGPLVQRECGGRLGPERISGIVRDLFLRAGLKVRNYDGRSAHGLRACYASDLIDAGAPPTVVAEAIGHVGLGNLGPYMRRTKVAQVREAVERRWSTDPAVA